MIKQITPGEALQFIVEHKEKGDQVACCNVHGEFFGYFKGKKLVGVISTHETKNTIRIKSFYVAKDLRGKGIGTKLMEHVLSNKEKVYTAFVSIQSYGVFKKHGFETVRENKYHIKFMRREKKDV